MNENIIVGIASDHAGFELKEFLIQNLDKKFTLKDYGTNSTESVDYPEFAKKICNSIKENTLNYGVLVCGSGIGMSIAANRNKSVRAALCYNNEIASLSRKHNNANIIIFGSRFITQEKALECLNIFLTEEFEAGRHLNRINKIDEE